MWAERLCAPGRLETIEVDTPIPAQIADGDVLLRTLAGGICGSDVPKFRGQKDAQLDEFGRFRPGRPGFPLHEVVGEVVAARTSELNRGELVVGWARGSDGLAEFVVTGKDDVATFDPHLTPADAVLIQPLACVGQALGRVHVVDRTVAVLGMGPIGIIFAHVARAWGARHVVGVDAVNRSGSPGLGFIDDIVHSTSADWAASIPTGARPDVVIEAVGHQVQTLDDAILACADGGTILCFGIPDQDIYPLNMELVMRKNLVIVGGVTRHRRNALLQANAYLTAHPELPGTLITHRFDRDHLAAAFEAAVTASPGRLKVVLELGNG